MPEVYIISLVPVDIQKDGSWSSFTTLGNPDDTGDRFDIIAVGVNQIAQNEINSYISDATSTPKWCLPGHSFASRWNRRVQSSNSDSWSLVRHRINR